MNDDFWFKFLRKKRKFFFVFNITYEKFTLIFLDYSKFFDLSKIFSSFMSNPTTSFGLYFKTSLTSSDPMLPPHPVNKIFFSLKYSYKLLFSFN